MRPLLLLVLAAAAFAADMKPNEQLPWCRVTLKMADGLKSFDGWYDSETGLLFGINSFTKNDLDPGSPLDKQSIVKVQVGTHSPKPMPPQARDRVNAERRRQTEDKRPDRR